MARPALAAAARVLAARFGGHVRLSSEEPLLAGIDVKPNVRRCRVEAGPPGCPGSVVVKRIVGNDPYDPCDVRHTGGEYGLPTVAWRLLAEWAATRFLTDRAGGHAPAPLCWGGDLTEGIVVLEDLGPGETLTDLLHGSDRGRAEWGLLEYTRRLAQLHAFTSGGEAVYRRLWADLGAGTSRANAAYHGAARVQEDLTTFRHLASALGVREPSGLDDEVAGILTMLRCPEPFLALCHGEFHAINTHVAGNSVRLLDFEYSRYGFCLADGMFPHLFTWTSHGLPDALCRKTESAYRQELATRCAAASDDRRFAHAWGLSRAALTFGTVAVHLSRGSLEADTPDAPRVVRVANEDAPDGKLTGRRRILLLLEEFAAESSVSAYLPALRELAQDTALRLSSRWEMEAGVLPLYPAFR